MKLPEEFWEQLPLRTDVELYDMLVHPEDYLPEALAAAKDELNKRDLAPERVAEIEAGVKARKFIPPQAPAPPIIATWNRPPESSPPKWEFGELTAEDLKRDLVTLVTCRSSFEADTIAGQLRVSGIAAVTPDDCRFRVQVSPRDYDTAKAFLLAPFDAEFVGLERTSWRSLIEHPVTGEVVSKTLVIDPGAELIDRSEPPFATALPGSKAYYGHPLLEATRVEGWCLGVVTDPFEPDCDSGCTIGDAFVEAPDGSRAGLVWALDEAPRFAVLFLPDSKRWGVFYLAVEQPIATMEQLRDAFTFMLPALKHLRLRYAPGGVEPPAPPNGGPSTPGNSVAGEEPPSVS